MPQLSFSIERNSGRNVHLGDSQMSGVHRPAANPDQTPIACDPELIFLLLVGNLEINRLSKVSTFFAKKPHQHCLSLAGGDPLQQGLGGQLEPAPLHRGLHQDGLGPHIQPASSQGEEQSADAMDLHLPTALCPAYLVPSFLMWNCNYRTLHDLNVSPLPQELRHLSPLARHHGGQLKLPLLIGQASTFIFVAGFPLLRLEHHILHLEHALQLVQPFQLLPEEEEAPHIKHSIKSEKEGYLSSQWKYLLNPVRQDE